MRSNLFHLNASGGGGATSIGTKSAHRQGTAYELRLKIYAEIQAGAVFMTPGFFIFFSHRGPRGHRD
jgi:hypothetical protein